MSWPGLALVLNLLHCHCFAKPFGTEKLFKEKCHYWNRPRVTQQREATIFMSLSAGLSLRFGPAFKGIIKRESQHHLSFVDIGHAPTLSWVNKSVLELVLIGRKTMPVKPPVFKVSRVEQKQIPLVAPWAAKS